MVYLFLEVAHRAWLSSAAKDGIPDEWQRGSEDIAYMLDRIARAGPEEKVRDWLLVMGCTCTPISPYIHSIHM
jgi:hypothetical protein